MEHVKAYLYDARGTDEEIDLESVNVTRLGEKQLLWIDISRIDDDLLGDAAALAGIEDMPKQSTLDDGRPPEVEKYEQFYRFCVDSVLTKESTRPERCRVRYVVGKNFIVIMHDGHLNYFDEFRQREKGESKLGGLDAEGFVASLLDLNIVTYFKALDEMERRIDQLDEVVLKKDFETEKFLEQMVALRRETSDLRRWLMPQREVYYALARADFQQVAESDSAEQYKVLSQHFENAVDAIEHARETVISVFELYATKSTHMTNMLVQRLTFLTLMTGSLAVIAGILGMNFKAEIFEIENGFWFTVSGLVVVAAAIAVFARFKRWI